MNMGRFLDELSSIISDQYECEVGNDVEGEDSCGSSPFCSRTDKASEGEDSQ